MVNTMEKHIPLRMCIACRKMCEQKSLIRIVNENGTAVLDIEKQRFGRGAYICADAECIKKAQKRKGVEKHLKCQVQDGLYEKCLNFAENKKG